MYLCDPEQVCFGEIMVAVNVSMVRGPGGLTMFWQDYDEIIHMGTIDFSPSLGDMLRMVPCVFGRVYAG